MAAGTTPSTPAKGGGFQKFVKWVGIVLFGAFLIHTLYDKLVVEGGLGGDKPPKGLTASEKARWRSLKELEKLESEEKVRKDTLKKGEYIAIERDMLTDPAQRMPDEGVCRAKVEILSGGEVSQAVFTIFGRTPYGQVIVTKFTAVESPYGRWTRSDGRSGQFILTEVDEGSRRIVGRMKGLTYSGEQSFSTIIEVIPKNMATALGHVAN